jgi:uncharacterized protein (TIGR01777 family)
MTMSALRVTVTGATGLIGSTLLAALRQRDAHVTVLSRDPARALARLGPDTRAPAEAVRWQPIEEPAPAQALAGRDAVIHLAGENVAQRWTARARRAIRDSRVVGTRHLLAGLREAEPRPGTLISASAVGYYGAHGEEPLDEEAPPGEDFLAQVCAAWEAEAQRAGELGVRVVQVRTGVVLDRRGGALQRMLVPFRLGLGGPVAGGRQYVSWVHSGDLVEMMLTACADARWSGPVNATAPEPAANRDFAHALGTVLGRPALLPVPGAALRLLYGEMARIVTDGARAVPAKPLVLGYGFRHPQLVEAMRSALASE